MNLIQTALIAIPAAIVGGIGGIGLASVSAPGARVAALWGGSGLNPLGGTSVERWESEIRRRGATKLELDRQIAAAKSRQEDASKLLASLETKRDAAGKLLESLEALENETRPAEQTRSRILGEWAAKAKACLATIQPADGKANPGDFNLMTEWSAAAAAAGPIEAGMAFNLKQKQLAAARAALDGLEIAINSRKAQVLSDQDDLRKKLEEIHGAYVKTTHH